MWRWEEPNLKLQQPINRDHVPSLVSHLSLLGFSPQPINLIKVCFTRPVVKRKGLMLLVLYRNCVPPHGFWKGKMLENP